MESIANQTRKVFDVIHRDHLKFENTKKRLRGLITCEQLGVAADFFKDKVCGDLGCGSSVHGTINLLNLGASLVHAMDVNETIIEPATAELMADKRYNDRWSLDIGELNALPYQDEAFDFVLCQGVIHHMDDDQAALDEIHRVLRPGGSANIMVAGQGGLINRFWMETARDEYKHNAELRNLLDSEDALAQIMAHFDWLMDNVEDDGSEAYASCMTMLGMLRAVVNDDLLLSFRDSFQAPLYKTYSMEAFGEMLRRAGFSSWRRVSRTPTFNNVRKLVAPLYGNPETDLAKILYGSGMLILMVEK